MQSRTGAIATTTGSLRDRLRPLLVQAATIVQGLEHGQASRPLTHHWNVLLEGLARKNATVLLVTLDESATEWARSFPSTMGCDTSEQIGTASSCLLTIETIQLTDVRLWNSVARASLMMLVGASQSLLTATDLALVLDLKAAGIHIESIIVGKAEDSHTTPWLVDGVPPLVVGSDLVADVRQLRDRIIENCEKALERWYLARINAAVALVRQIIEERMKLCDYRRRLLQATISGQRRVDQEPAQKCFESLRRLWEDQFGRFEAEVANRTREQLFPNSRISNRLRNLQDDLSAEDMREERTGKSTRLEVSADFRQRARQVLERSVEEIVQSDAQWLEQKLMNLQQESLREIAVPDVPLPTFSMARLDDQLILNDLRRRMELELRYTGEIPRRTWFDWLSQGRRPVFALTMILSIVGTAFGLGNGRSVLLGPLLLALFLAGTGWAFFVFREERRHLLQRELTRLRDVVDGELRRLIEDLFKDWQARGVNKLRDTQKEWTRAANDWAREQQLTSAKSFERQRTDAQEQLKLIDGRSRELGQWSTQIERLETALTEVAR